MNAEKLRKLNLGETDDRYFNRELSWLAFNQRVLDESRRSRTPLLERVKYVAICYSNLDEFFMVRVAGKKRNLRDGGASSEISSQQARQHTLNQIRQTSQELVQEIYTTFRQQLLPQLAQAGLVLQRFQALSASQRFELSQYYRQSVLPVLTPLAVDPAHPFPFLANRRLYLVILFASERQEAEGPPIAFVEVPSILPRLIPVPQTDAGRHFVLLEDLITEHLADLFFGLPVQTAFPIRITRNLDITLLESEVVDLMSSIQTEVKAREQAEVVRLELGTGMPRQLKDLLLQRFFLDPSDLYEVDGPLALADFLQIYELPGEDWRLEPFNPRLPRRMKGSRSIFTLIREADLMLHHPYESFYAVIELLHAAAWDPEVLAIKQTLYRTSGDSPIIDSLIQAAERGKQVTAVVELKARFDEHNNILWARRMEQAGVHVVYGFIGLKTHCKMTLIVRREDKRLQRYVHLSTGNYNSTSAGHYVDIGYITARSEFADDASLLFNLLTGFNILSRDEAQLKPKLSPMRKLLVAPLYLREALVGMIDREIKAHQEKGQGLIVAKMNALVDPVLIDKLYEASQAGVSIRLIVRGICCLRPQVEGLSKTIEVLSIVGRFLEHSRIFYFHNQGEEAVYLGSADWMPRNMDRRIEVVFPVEDRAAKRRVIDEILPNYWKDTANAWELLADGTYKRREGSGPAWDCHQKFIEIAREQGIKSLPYDKAIRHNLKRQGRPIVKKSAKKKNLQLKDRKH